MDNAKKRDIQLLLFIKYFIPFIVIPAIILFIKNLMIVGILLLLSGIISLIFKNQIDIIGIIYGTIFINFGAFHRNLDEKGYLIIYLFIIISLLSVFLIDLIRLIIFLKFKGRKLIKNKDEVEFLHYIFYKILKRKI